MLSLVCAMQKTEKCCARLKCNKYHFACVCVWVYALFVPTVRLNECLCVCAIVCRKDKL